jgi:WD40 repeat protein
MLSPLGSESGRRLLIAAGTARFEGLVDSDLLRVPEELGRIVASFAALGYERQKTAFSSDPDSGRLRTLFSDVKKESRAEDLVVAYYTGHGARDTERFYLLARNSTSSDLDGTALPAEDLARALIKDSKAFQVLVIFDACFAGAGAAEFLEIANRLVKMAGGGPEVFVIAAARSKQEADEGALSSALAEAFTNGARLGGRTQAFLAIDDVMREVKRYLRENHPAQKATWSSSNVEGGCDLFPNPLHRPEVRPGLDLETQRAFAEHWVPKASGTELGAGASYFTGRDRAVRELVAWLSAERSDGRARVVTGGPGCGKSAVLARIVTLADPTYRKEVLAATRSVMLDSAMLPPEGVISVAVHARHKLLAEVAAQIAAGLSLAAREPAELLAAVARRPEKAVIVVDALDEADDKEQIVSRLFRPLAELQQIFLLVGTRPDSSEHGRRFRALGEEVVEIDLDLPRYIGADDVALYVERRLLAAEEPGRPTPYRDSPETAYIVARAVAERARGVFLVARTTVHALLSAESIVDVTQRGWVERLPTGLDEAFTQFLAQLDTRRPGGLSSAKARAVLLPLAFAEGEGLPWVDLWCATASALSSSNISDAEVALVCEHVAPFIVEAVEQDRSVYRLYHESLAELLRGSVVDARGAQQRIVETLRARVPDSPDARRPDWTRAHPYVLMHLAAHALKAGTLGELVTDGAFLAAADPLRAIQALSVSTDPQAQRAYACYSLAFDRLRDQPADIRLSYLQMVARQQSHDELAEIWGRDGLPRRWRVRWARFLPVTTHRTIWVPTCVSSVACGMLGRRPIIVSGGADGMVRVWDLASGKQRGEPLRGHKDEVTSVALAALDGRAVIVSGGMDSTLRVWDLASGKQRGEPLRGHKDLIALCTLDGRPVAVLGESDRTVRVWDLASGKQHGESLRGHDRWVTSVALGTLDGRPVAVSGESDGTVRVWDLASGKQRGEPLRGHEDPVKSVALGTLDGRPVIVSGAKDLTVRVWDLASGKQRGEPLRGHDGWVTSVALGTLGDRTVIVSGGMDSTLRVWDLASGKQHGEPLRGHADGVTSVALAALDGRAVIVSGAMDSTLRVWDLPSGTQCSDPPGDLEYGEKSDVLDDLDDWSLLLDGKRHVPPHEYSVGSVALGTLGDRPMIVSGGMDSTVRVWDVSSGKQRGEPLRGHTGPVTSVACGTLDGPRVIVLGADGSTARVWDLASGKPRYDEHCSVCSVTLGTLDGRPVIVSGGIDGTVRVWNLASGPWWLFTSSSRSFGYRLCLFLKSCYQRSYYVGLELRGQPMHGHKNARVDSVACGMLDGRPVIVSGGSDAMVRVWDLASGTPRGEPLLGHKGPVTSVACGTLDGRPVIVSGGSDAMVRVWDLASGTPRGEPLLGHKGPVTSVACGTLDGRPVIVSGGMDSTMRVWDAAGSAVFSVGIGSDVMALAFAGPGTLVLAASRGLLLFQFEK